MIAAPMFPDASHPGLKLMAATAASLRAGRTAPAGDLVAASLGGALLEQEPPIAVAADGLDRILTRIDAIDQLESKARQATMDAARRLGEMAALPDATREAAFAAVEAGERWSFAGLGIRRLLLPVGGDGRTELLRIEPGSGAPRHDHEGDEYTLVLTGAFHDGHRLFAPGDVNIGGPGFVHQPVAQPGAVCFALAVSWGEPRFEGVFGLMQKLTRH